jgi:transcriptional regulator with XRE-family HTH domain
MPVIVGNLTAAAQQLIRALRAAREARGMTSRALSEQLGYSHAWLSHRETGRQIATVAEVVVLVDAMGVGGEERESILTYAREANAPNPLALVPGIPPALVDTIADERAVCAIQEWAPVIVPDLVQTPAYTAALATSQGCDPIDADTRSLIQSGRQRILTRAIDPVGFTAVIGESALREPIASAQVMAEQLDFLLAQTVCPNVTIRVMPASAGWHRGLTGPFRLYHLPDGQEFARHDHFGSACVVTGRTDEYRTAVAEMIPKALSVGKSIRRLTDIAQEWRDVGQCKNMTTRGTASSA